MAISLALAQCVDAFRAGDLAQCKPLGFGPVDWITIIGFFGALSFGLFRGFRYFLTRLSVNSGKIYTFYQLRKNISPIMRENRRRFENFGPNSGSALGGEVRFDLSAWRNVREEISEDNQKIATLIRENWKLIPKKFQADFSSWLSHIDAFTAHIQDESVDYRNNQFPKNISSIIDGK